MTVSLTRYLKPPKRKLTTIYVIVMALLGIGTYLVSLPDVALIVVFWTLGLASVPMVVAVNIFIYGLCLAPWVWLRNTVGGVLAALCVIYAAGSPAARGISDRAEVYARLIAEDITVTGIKDTIAQVPIIEFTNARPYTAGGNPLYKSGSKAREDAASLCTTICEYLLSTGQVAAVRLPGKPKGYVGGTDDRPTYVWNGHYAALASQSIGPADLRMTYRGFRPGQIKEFFGVDQVNTTHLKVYIVGQFEAYVPARDEVVLRQTVLYYNRPFWPAVYVPVTSGLTSGGNEGGIVAAHRRAEAPAGHSTEQVFTALGFDMSGFVADGAR